MQMRKFRVQNYKKIQDTDWIKCGDITAFVGKNESGKSALFRGLSKINPSDGEKYNGLKEFPRKRYAAEFKQKDWPVCSVKFQLESKEIDKLKHISSMFNKTTEIIITRHYSNKHKIDFNPPLNILNVSVDSYKNHLKRWKSQINSATASEGRGERLRQIKNSLNSVFDSIIQQIESKDLISLINTSLVQQVSDAMASNANEEWEKQLLQKMIHENNKFDKMVQSRIKISEAKKWILTQVPKYIYFDRYDMIVSAIHIRKFVQEINSDPTDAQLRTTKCLFQHAGLDAKEIGSLDPAGDSYDVKLERMARERHILMSSASATMTKKFEDWWEQKKYKFRYDVDGQFFRVWVSDNLDPSEIELDQRSAGMQYFFSFYVVFLEEASGAHQNSILLLDEPGLHYHGTAQMKAVKFLQKISQDNQLLYSTHSPFMIDGDKLSNVRIVYEDKYGHTLVSTDVWPNDSDSLFPLQAGLGYTLAQSLFYSKYNLVVEGITDYLILKAMNEVLRARAMTTLDHDIVIIPAGGARNMMPLASLLVGNQLRLVILMDGDDAGIEKEKQLKKNLMVDCILISTLLNESKLEIEDLFDEDFYTNALQKAYPNVKIQFNVNEKDIVGITKKIDSVFKRLKCDRFNKWLVTSIIVSLIQNNSETNKISKDTCLAFEKIFTKVNSLMK